MQMNDTKPVRKLVHTMRQAIRWGDMDVLGHVNNTIYFRYLEIIRLDWIAQRGMKLGPEGEGFLIINAFCTFHQQLEYPGDVLGRMYVSNVGRSSLESWHTLERTDQPGVVYASGGAKTVWVDFKAQKSVPLPDWLRQVVAVEG